MLLKTLLKKNDSLFFSILLNSSLNILNFEFENFIQEILIRFRSFLTSIFFIVVIA